VASRSEPLIYLSVHVGDTRSTERVEMTDRVIRLEYQDLESKADKLSLEIDNADLAHFDDPVWRKGNMLDVSWGYPGNMSPVRTCQIRKVSGFESLEITAIGREIEMNGIRRSRTWENVRISDVVREIAAANGYSDPRVVHIQDTEDVLPLLLQPTITDSQQITRLAKRAGFVWFIDWDGFHFHERALYQDPIKEYVWRGGEGDLLSVTVDNDVIVTPGAVRAAVRAPSQRRTIETKASNDSEQARDVLSGITDLVDPNSDVGKLVAMYRKLSKESAGLAASETEAAAQRATSGKFRHAQHSAFRLTLEAAGDPNVFAKSVVRLSNAGKRLSQNYYAKEVTTTIDSSGYVDTLKVLSDGAATDYEKRSRVTGADLIVPGVPTTGRRNKKPAKGNPGIDKPPGSPPAPLGEKSGFDDGSYSVFFTGASRTSKRSIRDQ